MSDFNTINNNDFMIEKIKERPISRRKLIRRTVITVSMAVIFGLVACFTFLLLEPVISNYLYPEEEAEVVVFPEDEEEMKPEEMLEEKVTTPETIPQEPVSAQIDQEQVAEILDSVSLDKSHYVQLYDVMSDYVAELQKSMVTVTSVKEDSDWLDNSYERTNDTTGVIIAVNNKDIYILTDYAVLKKADEIQVTFSNSKKSAATLVGKHTETNIAVLSISREAYGTEDEVKQIAVAQLGSSRISNMVGEPVVVLGSPMGVNGSVGYGMITAMTEETGTVDYNYDVIMTDIYGSQSAKGILFNMKGQVIGIVSSAKVSVDLKNLVMAYGISDLKNMITALSAGKPVPYLGIKGISVTEEANEESQIPLGAYVTDVVMNSPAMLAGLQKGDIIIGVGETIISDYSDFASAMYRVGGGKTVKITLMRQSQGDYKEMSMEIALIGAN